MYGYPEQFIPIPELVGYGAAPHVATPAQAPAPAAPMSTTQEVTA
jgi:Amt family ammonium transporter